MKNVSVVMIAKNEEDIIKYSLASVSWANEIIVVIDKSSTDNTAKVAKSLKAKVYERAWSGYADQKNFGISKAKNSWILNIDADEIVSEGLAKEIGKLKNRKVDGYYIPFKNYLGKKWLKHGGLYPDYHLRLVKKELAIFKSPVQGGQIHEHIQAKHVIYLKNPIDHYTYADIKDFWQRVIRYSTQEGKELAKLGKKPSIMDVLKVPLRFIKAFFLQKGFMDGWLGFINAFFLSYYQFNKVKYMLGGKK